MRLVAALLALAYAALATTRADHLAPLAIAFLAALGVLSVVAMQLRSDREASRKSSDHMLTTAVPEALAENDNANPGRRAS